MNILVDIKQPLSNNFILYIDNNFTNYFYSTKSLQLVMPRLQFGLCARLSLDRATSLIRRTPNWIVLWRARLNMIAAAIAWGASRPSASMKTRPAASVRAAGRAPAAALPGPPRREERRWGERGGGVCRARCGRERKKK